MWKEKVLKAYKILWLEEIEDKVIYFTHKTAKYMLDHINKQCISLTNTNTKDHLKETDLLWNPEEDIAMYFTKPHKEEERLKKTASAGINCER